MAKIFRPLSVFFLAALAFNPVWAKNSGLNSYLAPASWQCQQKIVSEDASSLDIRFKQTFTANKTFSLVGSIEINFPAEVVLLFGEGKLLYDIEGTGTWQSLASNKLVIKTQTSTVKPASPLAHKLHSAGVLDVENLQNKTTEDEFELNQLSPTKMQLTHLKENFDTSCTRL